MNFQDILINNRYRLDRKICEGGFGFVYLGTDKVAGVEVAIKLENIYHNHDSLEREAEAYKVLSGGAGIPRVGWFGREGDFYVLVLDLLGPSLEDLFNYCGRKFSLKTVLLLADQLICRIQHIHANCFLHCDIKPENFLIGIGRQGNIVHAVDFGLAKKLHKGKRRKSLKGPFTGTCCFASVNNHVGRELSRGDDLESIGYLLLYFACGSLPWQGMKTATEDEKLELTKNMKIEISLQELCKDLPSEFERYMEYTRSLDFCQKPDYSYLRKLFRNLFVRQGFRFDNVFDWTINRFKEIQRDLHQSTFRASAESLRKGTKSSVSKTKAQNQNKTSCST
ncbi:casein kinase I [Xylogone sp. PMI_703]|nr:casein kinase I [Xylogone sp. PMI_703]